MVTGHQRCRAVSVSDVHLPFWRMSRSKVKLTAQLVSVLVVATITYSVIWGRGTTFRKVQSYHRISDFKYFTTESVMKEYESTISSVNQTNRQYVRHKHMAARCAQLGRGSLDFQALNHIIVDDTHRIMYCYVPKVACSNWKRIFLHMTGMFDYLRPEHLKHNDVHFTYRSKLNILSDYSTRSIYERLFSYKKFLFVRHPLERLLSAYRDKLAGVGFEDPTYQNVASIIYEKYHQNQTLGSQANITVKRGDVSFVDFVKYLVEDDNIGRGVYNEHWERQIRLCNPCVIDYDYIGKYETLEEDANWILAQTGLSQKYSFPKRSSFYNNTKTIQTFSDYYSKVPAIYTRKLWKLYKNDFLMFDYKFPFKI